MVNKVLETDVIFSDSEDVSRVRRICDGMVELGAVVTQKITEAKSGGFFSRGYAICTIRVQYKNENSAEIEGLVDDIRRLLE